MQQPIPELGRSVARLPEALKAGILAMVKAAPGRG